MYVNVMCVKSYKEDKSIEEKLYYFKYIFDAHSFNYSRYVPPLTSSGWFYPPPPLLIVNLGCKVFLKSSLHRIFLIFPRKFSFLLS